MAEPSPHCRHPTTKASRAIDRPALFGSGRPATASNAAAVVGAIVVAWLQAMLAAPALAQGTAPSVAPGPAGTWSAAVKPAPASPSLPKATAIRISGNADRTDVSIEVDRTIVANMYTLDEPYRLIVDVPELEFSLQARAAGASTGLIKDYRYGRFDAARSRIVLDLSGPVEIVGASFAPPAGRQPGALRFSLVKVDPARFQSFRGSADAPGIPAAQPQLRSGRHEETDRTPPPPKSDRTRGVVVIDPGHGGIDPGTVGAGGATEKSITLAVAREVRALLQQQRRLDVYLTRDMDQFVSLDQRVKLSREYAADLFVSIHADSLAEKDQVASVRGATVYVLSERATDDRARRVAEKENAADVLAGLTSVPASAEDQVRGILLDLVQRETSDYAAAFRNLLLSNMRGRIPLAKDPQRAAAFKVLKQDDVPAVLIELGYMSNAEDLARLARPEGQRQMAAAIAASINAFFSRREAKRTP